MRRYILLWGMVLGCVGLMAQGTGNPFDLGPRLPEAAAAPAATAPLVSSNPFDVGTAVAAAPVPAATDSAATGATQANPFEVTAGTANTPPPPVRTPNGAAVAPLPGATDTTYQGMLLGIVVLVLGMGTVLFIFFRTLLYKTYTALFNDNLLSQLYRERKSGAIGQFVLSYLLFFMGAALFLSLTAGHFGHLTHLSLWERFVLLLGAIGGAYLLKHAGLALLGYIFPVKKEVSMYSFTVMIFAIAMGIVLMFGSVLLAYAQESWRIWIIYGTGGSLLLLLLLRSARGLFIGSRFIFNYKFHFISYLCAVELGPTLCLIKFLIPS